MRGVILGIHLHDYMSVLRVGDLVVIDDGFDDFCVITKIDPRYGKLEGDPDTPYMYFVKSKTSNSSRKYENYERGELSKANVGFFDYDAYYGQGKRILLGAVSFMDTNYIKGKFAVDYDIPFSQFDRIKLDDIIGLDFYGDSAEKEINYDTSPDCPTKSVVKYFMIDKPE